MDDDNAKDDDKPKDGDDDPNSDEKFERPETVEAAVEMPEKIPAQAQKKLLELMKQAYALGVNDSLVEACESIDGKQQIVVAETIGQNVEGTQEIKEGDEISVEDTGNQRREEGTPKPKRLRSEGDALDDSKADGEHKANFTTPKKVSAAVYEKISESVCKVATFDTKAQTF